MIPKRSTVTNGVSPMSYRHGDFTPEDNYKGNSGHSGSCQKGSQPTGKTYLFLKRTIDIILASFGLIATLPLLPIIALLIKLDSRGPVFYLATRVGKNLKIFKMYKFRTMIETPVEVGHSVSPKHDPRVTAFGHFLRRSKINEFPQLLNILKGEMTFVGPRPESPDMAEKYHPEALEVFSVTPGLVGPNQILGRNEEEMYPPGVDVEKFYLENIVPPKVEVDLEYIRTPGIFKDIKYILHGVRVTLFEALDKKHLRTSRSQLYLLFADITLIILSFTLAYSASFPRLGHAAQPFQPVWWVPIALAVRLSLSVFFGLYNTLIRHISQHDILIVGKSVTLGSLIFLLLGFFAGSNNSFTLFIIIDWLCLMTLLSGLRLGIHLYWKQQHDVYRVKRKSKILIYGAGKQGNSAYRLLTTDRDDFEVVGFIDDAPDKYGKKLNGCKVLGNRHHIDALAKLHKVDEVILAGGAGQAQFIDKAVEICQRAGLRYRLFSRDKAMHGDRLQFPIKNVELTDLLSLKRIRADRGAARKILTDKTVLVNGSGGEMGLELCSHILWSDCSRLIILDRYESYLRQLTAQLHAVFPEEKIIPVLIGNNRKSIFLKTFETYKPDVVFHAGLKKYEPTFATADHDLSETNYDYSMELANLSMGSGTSFFVLISSFVATNGSGELARSLLYTEHSLQKLFKSSNCRLVIPRVCDIVENHGGIVSVLESQISRKKSVILPSTNTETTLLSKYSAAEFIMQCLVETAKEKYEDGIFVCKAGPPIPVDELAGKIAHFHGMNLELDLIVRYKGTAENSSGTASSIFTDLEPTSHRDINFLKIHTTT